MTAIFSSLYAQIRALITLIDTMKRPHVQLITTAIKSFEFDRYKTDNSSAKSTQCVACTSLQCRSVLFASLWRSLRSMGWLMSFTLTVKHSLIVICPMPQEVSLQISPMSQETGLEISLMPQEAGLEISPMSQEDRFKISPVPQEAGLEISSMPQKTSLEEMKMIWK